MSVTTRRTDDDWVDVSARPVTSAFYACDPDWDLAPRRRGHYQLWTVTSGAMEFRLGSGPSRLVTAGSLILLPPRVVQSGGYRSGELGTYVTKFMAFDHGVPNLKLWPAAIISDVDEAAWSRLLADVAELTDILEGADAGSRSHRLLATAAMTAILGRIEHLPPSPTPRAGRTGRKLPDTVAAAVAIIKDRPDDSLTTGALAAEVHTSSDALRKAFHRTMGQSPGEYVRQYRLSLARSLLRQTELSIATIARRTGFADPFYFSRVFRAAEGVPPSHWRDSLDDPLITSDSRPTRSRNGHR